jgi:undecaprenyl-diphosphatase
MSRAGAQRNLFASPWRSAWERALAVLDFLTRHGWVPLIAMLLALIGFWGFLELADDVQEGETNAFDRWVFEHVAGRYETIGKFAQEGGRDLTALGGTTVITLMVAGVTIFLLLRRQWKSAGFVLVAVLGGLAISLLLKEFYDRARPDIYAHQSHTSTSSFPSGHSANAAVAYLTMAILLAKLVESAKMKAYVLAGGLLIPLLVGLSRIFVGVHWPTDVLAGWLIGLAWGLFVYAAATYLQEHGKLEQEGEIEEKQP